MAIVAGFPWRSVGLAAVVLVALLLLAQSPTARAQTPAIGAGILSVDGTASENVTLPVGGTYYLTVATDDASSFVDAKVLYNGTTVLARENRSRGASTIVSLPAGNYSISLAGRGRAALGWDFTNGSVQDFPDNQTLVAFLVPSGPRLQVYVSMGNARSIALRVFDDGLVAAGNATVTASGPVDFLLAPTSASIAYLVATVTSGAPGGIYGLSWTAGPLNPPLDFTSWPLFLLWIVVPVAVALLVLVLLHGRRGRQGTGL